MKYDAWTYFVGSEEEAKEFVNEWNEITKSDSFRVGFRKGGASLIEGEVSSEILETTNIENEFVIEEK
jgi:hypothetical protein